MQANLHPHKLIDDRLYPNPSNNSGFWTRIIFCSSSKGLCPFNVNFKARTRQEDNLNTVNAKLKTALVLYESVMADESINKPK